MADFVLIEDNSIPFYQTMNLGPDCVWVDEFEYSKIKQNIRATLDGHTLIEYITPGLDNAGRSIHLTGMWYDIVAINGIRTSIARLTQLPMELTLSDGRVFDVVWDFDNLGMRHANVLPRPDYDDKPIPDYWITDLFLIIIEE